jgi:hypothetical protein
MTNMPERIWATPFDSDFSGGGTYCDAAERPTAPNHDAWCYIRADLYGMLKAQQSAILSAMERYRAGEPSNPPVTGVAKADLTDISETGKGITMKESRERMLKQLDGSFKRLA